MIFAAIYARVSTEEQANRENSIPAQIRLIKEYCQKNNIQIYNEYVDEGISGQKEDRPAFQKMIKDAKGGHFSVILVHKFDRFARKIELSRKIKTELKKAGVNVISITEPVEDSPIGFFQEGLMELLAEYYVKNLSKEVKKGMSERALKGKYMGQMPYGYYIENGQVKVNQEQAKVVRDVFNRYINGWGHLKIARYLNDSKIPTYSGIIGGWQSFQVCQMLKNYKYIGKNLWDGQLYNADFPKLIDEDLFEFVQNRMRDRKKKYTYHGSNYNDYLLLGILRCRECDGAARARLTNKGRPGEYPSYLCARASMYRNQCTFTKHFHTYKLEQDIEDVISQIVDNKHYLQDFRIVTKHSANTIDTTEEQIKRIDKELQRAKDAYLAEVFSLEEYKIIKEELETKKEKLTFDYSNMQLKQMQNNINTLHDKIKTIWSTYYNLDIAQKKVALLKFIDVIYIGRDGIEIIFYI